MRSARPDTAAPRHQTRRLRTGATDQNLTTFKTRRVRLAPTGATTGATDRNLTDGVAPLARRTPTCEVVISGTHQVQEKWVDTIGGLVSLRHRVWIAAPARRPRCEMMMGARWVPES